jgi:hypothetical protein
MFARHPHPTLAARHSWLLILCLLIALAALDAQRAPDRQLGAKVMLLVIDGWQMISPTVAKTSSCVYTPSCSVYGELVVRRYGGYRGGWLALKRIFRCSPWAEKPGEDWP